MNTEFFFFYLNQHFEYGFYEITYLSDLVYYRYKQESALDCLCTIHKDFVNR